MRDQYGPWKVIEYKGKEVYKCQCSCGLIKKLKLSDLEKISVDAVCSHKIPNRKDLTGKHFGDWEVIKPTKAGYYLCRCSCENHTLREVYGTTLRTGKSTSCGHNTTGFKDLTGRQFGNWEVLEYVGNHLWKCRCSCDKHTIKLVDRFSLISGASTSCGCNTVSKIQQTLIDHGHTSQRTKEQLEMVSSKENFEKMLESFNTKPTILDIASKTGLNVSSVGVYIHKYCLEDAVDINSQTSQLEKDVLTEIKSLAPDLNIITKDRTVLNGKELDIYIPEKQLAVEVNGNYWHSTIFKEPNYHQNKTLACLNKGILLISIFEYEWNDLGTRNKILKMLENKLKPCTKTIYARNTEVKCVDRETSEKFLKQYHLQGYAPATISLGLFDKNELIGIMTFGTPRFNSNYQYEIVRLAYKDDIICVGGTEKLFSNFNKIYKPESIISYCNISKFSGNTYKKLCMKEEYVSKPNYVWFRQSDNTLLHRYQTTKAQLLKLGLGDDTETEDDIMYRQGFLKIYDSGNKVFTWHNSEDTRG